MAKYIRSVVNTSYSPLAYVPQVFKCRMVKKNREVILSSFISIFYLNSYIKKDSKLSLTIPYEEDSQECVLTCTYLTASVKVEYDTDRITEIVVNVVKTFVVVLQKGKSLPSDAAMLVNYMTKIEPFCTISSEANENVAWRN